jgi:uncharacterized membrane protein YcjF (UPF0283 family)
MTEKNTSRQAIGFGSLGIVGLLIAAAVGAEGEMVRETFQQTAERWGIFAAIAVALTTIAVVGLIVVTRFVITTLNQVVDDNTLVMQRLIETMRARPCLSDSDLDRIAEESSLGETAQRVIDRRKARAVRRDGAK